MKLRTSGEIRVPGDKSITHRALMLAAAANGTSRLSGALAGADCRSTAAVLRALGCGVPDLPGDGAEITIQGGGLPAWRAPREPLDCGNSGTTARLILGLLAGLPIAAVITGDGSLRSRPMRRVTNPLSEMGARVNERESVGHLPLELRGGALRSLYHRSPTPSAQVKSALLFAGLSGGVAVSICEPLLSRDHTERLLRGMGVGISAEEVDGGWLASLTPAAGPLPPLDLHIPGDPSSAAFFVALALLADEGELCIRGVGTNPTRTGFLRVLARMGGFVEIHDEREEGGEPTGDLVIRPARLRGTEILPAEIPSLIDELPILAALAARAEGDTRISGAAELRVKESDRIIGLVENLRAIGVETEELRDGFVVRGTERPLAGQVRTAGDHRIAMAFGVLAALPGNRIRIDDRECAEVSFPGFVEQIGLVTGTGLPRAPDGIIVAIDGPAGSGKSSTAKVVAAALGYRHLDSGAFYRAITLAALRANVAPERWSSLTAAELESLGVKAVPVERGYRITLHGEAVDAELRGSEVNDHVSRMAAVPAVREWLLGALREAGERGGLVADGRDIGTVVFPEAELKIFLVADARERARRRLREQGVAAPDDAAMWAEEARLAGRDEIDTTRAVAPLLQA
ncbi:MAG: 3-phosphoshikimate 1-carboxyvinyltransferase, partial [Gemmatimonadota bacterium]|nr:3-phosphoshikimate 1-carboxyvinyltransferase [Gemmatimonadota bacterium]